MQEIKVTSGGKRIDAYLASETELSRSKIEKLIKDEIILVNDKKTKASYKVQENDLIFIDDYEEDIMDAIPENIPLDIVYEDDELLVINKPNGMVVHPAPGNMHGTLVNALLYHFKDLSNKDTIRPGIVHRIDAYTTGLLMVAKNDYAHNFLADELAKHKTERIYIALVDGVINNTTGTIDAPIGRDKLDRKKMAVTDVNSKEAITHFKVLKRFNSHTLLEIHLETGRTHQIRVHMSYIGHPVTNDPVYGKHKLYNDDGQCLHAKTLSFTHPKTLEKMTFDSELPKCFTDILNRDDL